MPEIVTTVKAKSPYGIKTEVWGDEWANWSKPEFRGEPFNENVKTGDRVQLTYAKADNGKVYITTIDKVVGGRVGEPSPPDDAFSAMETDVAFGTAAPSEPSAPTEDYGQSLWAKDRLRARTDCIACATGIYKSVIEAGIYKEFPSAETVTKYAAVLEEWAKGE